MASKRRISAVPIALDLLAAVGLKSARYGR